LARATVPVEPAQRFWIDAAALLLTARFVLRDLADAGANLILLGLVWIGLYAIARGRRWAGAGLVGLATALKLTPALFILYFVYRRRYATALAALASAALFTLLPAVALGAAFARVAASWWSNPLQCVAAADPTVGALGVEPIGNQALRPALGRLLTGPLVALGLPPAAVALVAWTIVAALVVASFRALREDPADPSSRALDVWDWAALSVLTLLLSPITWRAHAVAVLPACWLLVGASMVWNPAPRAALVALVCLAVPNLLLTRALTGGTVDAVVHRASLFTWVFVA